MPITHRSSLRTLTYGTRQAFGFDCASTINLSSSISKSCLRFWLIKNNIQNRLPVSHLPSNRHDVRSRERGLAERGLISTYSSLAAQASPVNIHNPRDGYLRPHRL